MPVLTIGRTKIIGWKDAQTNLTGSIFDDGAAGTEVLHVDASGNVLTWKAGRSAALNTLPQLITDQCYVIKPQTAIDIPNNSIGFGVSSVPAPTNLIPSSPAPGEFRINYTAVSGAIEYTLEYSDDGGSNWEGNQKITGTTFTWTGLSAGSYLARVNVRTAAGTSDFVQTSSGTSVLDTTLFVLAAEALPNVRPSSRAAVEAAIRQAADGQAFTGENVLATLQSANLALHFSSVSPLSAIYRDAGVTIAAEGEKIYRIASFADTAVNVDQTTSSLRPTLFGWGMRTVATKTERLQLPLSFMVNSNYTIFAAAARVQTSNSTFLGGDDQGTTAHRNMILGWASDTFFRFQHSNSTSVSLTVSGFTTPTMEYWGARLSDTGRTLWRNGTQVASTTNAAKLVAYSSPAIGRQFGNNENCGVRWFFAYNQALTDSQMLQLTRFTQAYDQLTSVPSPVVTPVPPTPTAPVATSPSPGVLQADWALATGGIGEAVPTGYQVEYNVQGSSSWLGTATKTSTTTTHQFTTGLTSGSSYRIRVRTTGANGNSASVTSGYVTLL